MRIKKRLWFTASGERFGAFLSALQKEGIPVNHFMKDGETAKGCIAPRDYKRAAKLARKNDIKLKILRKEGLAFSLYPYRKRLGLIGGGCFILALLIFLQYFTWEIVIPGEHTLSDRQILSALKEAGLSEGTFLPTADLNQITLKALEQLPGVSSLALNRIGSRIEVELREETPKPKLQDESPTNIVAAKTGQILELRVFSGQAVVTEKATVSQGDLIVSGVLEGADGNFIYRKSTATVLAKTLFEKTFSVALSQTTEELTGETDYQKRIVLFGKKIPLWFYSAPKENSLIKTETEPLTLFGITLPVEIETTVISYYTETQVAFSEEEGVQMLEKAAAAYEEESLKDAQILSREIKAEKEGNTLVMTIRYQCIEDIASEVPLDTTFLPNS